MYDGVGLRTPRGSGASGYVQTNKLNPRGAAHVKHWSENDNPGPAHKKPNQEIMDHKRRREIEAKVFELRMQLEDDGCSASDVEQRLACERSRLQCGSTGPEGTSNAPETETQQTLQRRQVQMEKIRMMTEQKGMNEGDASDREREEQRRRQPASDREAMEKEHKKRLKEGKKGREDEDRRRKDAEKERRKQEKRRAKDGKERGRDRVRARDGDDSSDRELGREKRGRERDYDRKDVDSEDKAHNERDFSDSPLEASPNGRYDEREVPKRRPTDGRLGPPEQMVLDTDVEAPRLHKAHGRVVLAGALRQQAQNDEEYEEWQQDPHKTGREGDEAMYVAEDYHEGGYWVERPRILRRVPVAAPGEYYEVDGAPQGYVTHVRGYPAEVVDERVGEGEMYYPEERLRPVARLAPRGRIPPRGRTIVRGGPQLRLHGEPGYGRAVYRAPIPGHYARGGIPRAVGGVNRDGLQPDEGEHQRIVRMGAPMRYVRGAGVRIDRGRGRTGVVGVGGHRPMPRRFDSLGLDMNAPGYYRKGEAAPERYNPEEDEPEELRRGSAGKRWEKIRQEDEVMEEVEKGHADQSGVALSHQGGAVGLPAVQVRGERYQHMAGEEIHPVEGEPNEDMEFEMTKSPSPQGGSIMETPPSRKRRPSQYRSECPSPSSDYYEKVLASRKRNAVSPGVEGPLLATNGVETRPGARGLEASRSASPLTHPGPRFERHEKQRQSAPNGGRPHAKAYESLPGMQNGADARGPNEGGREELYYSEVQRAAPEQPAAGKYQMVGGAEQRPGGRGGYDEGAGAAFDARGPRGPVSKGGDDYEPQAQMLASAEAALPPGGLGRREMEHREPAADYAREARQASRDGNGPVPESGKAEDRGRRAPRGAQGAAPASRSPPRPRRPLSPSRQGGETSPSRSPRRSPARSATTSHTSRSKSRSKSSSDSRGRSSSPRSRPASPRGAGRSKSRSPRRGSRSPSPANRKTSSRSRSSGSRRKTSSGRGRSSSSSKSRSPRSGSPGGRKGGRSRSPRDRSSSRSGQRNRGDRDGRWDGHRGDGYRGDGYRGDGYRADYRDNRGYRGRGYQHQGFDGGWDNRRSGRDEWRCDRPYQRPQPIAFDRGGFRRGGYNPGYGRGGRDYGGRGYNDGGYVRGGRGYRNMTYRGGRFGGRGDYRGRGGWRGGHQFNGYQDRGYQQRGYQDRGDQDRGMHRRRPSPEGERGRGRSRQGPGASPGGSPSSKRRRSPSDRSDRGKRVRHSGRRSASFSNRSSSGRSYRSSSRSSSWEVRSPPGRKRSAQSSWDQPKGKDESMPQGVARDPSPRDRSPSASRQ